MLVAIAACVSGAAIGINNSALLGAALEPPRPEHRGRHLGAFSAAGALGQFVGPLAAFAILHAVALFGGVLSTGLDNYPVLFLCLSAFPLVWVVALLARRAR